MVGGGVLIHRAYARFEANNTFPAVKLSLVHDSPATTLLTHEVIRAFRLVNSDKALGPTPSFMVPLQFAYRINLFTDDSVAMAVHTALSHLDRKNTYVRMLLIDYSSAFNTIILAKFIIKLHDLGINTHMYNWILYFLPYRPQVVRVGDHTSSLLPLSTGALQEYVFVHCQEWINYYFQVC